MSTKSVTETVLAELESNGEHEVEESSHSESGWLVSYADMMTLLFGFFVLMYSQSSHFSSIQSSIADKFSKPDGTPAATPVDSSQQMQQQIKRLESDLAAARAQIDQLKASSTTQIADTNFIPNKTDSTLEKTQVELAEAKRLIGQQQKELRLASNEPCRLCVSWNILDDPEIAKALGSPGSKGVVITDVKVNGPAERAGLRIGDIITQINNKSVQSFAEADKSFQGLPVNANVPLVVLREGKEVTLHATLDYLSQDEVRRYEAEEMTAPPIDIYPGLKAQNLSTAAKLKNYISSSIQGILITHVQKGTEAERSAITEGSVVQFIDGQKITSTDQASKLLRSGRNGHILLISSRNSKRFVTLK